MRLLHVSLAFDVSDVFAVVAAFGGTVADGSPYLDRSPLGLDVWNTGPGDGSITVSDVFLAVGQFGHTCSE